MSPSLLSHLRGRLVVDVDSMDPAVASRHTGTDQQFCDMTSNQAIVCSEAARRDKANILKAACDNVRGSEATSDTQVADALDLLNILLAKEVYPYLTGRVHVQTSPSTAYDTERTVAHAKKLVALFEANGIPSSRVCIKIPATPESIVACQYLEKIGIRTLATCLFSVHQAVAASQAGCLYVAPYFNELRVHFEPGLWKEYENTVLEHPMAPIIGAIVQTFKGIGSNTLVMPASIVTLSEAIALASLNPDHLTLSAAVLDQLAAANSPENVLGDPKSHHPEVHLATPPTSTGSSEPSILETNFLSKGADALRQALAADAEAQRKLADALKIFDEMEQQTKTLIRQELGL
ncbi:Transaldolase [Sparassis crispa]|uniref:Transaldolase n=1 Tax=Sparassis crispa TaxID=139825 RepID=A0A401G7Q3_9APHY|nr:Transaldolase [Sparassis crispa]GBE78196.1 Transaldolase [Sparassis crispa]